MKEPKRLGWMLLLFSFFRVDFSIVSMNPFLDACIIFSYGEGDNDWIVVFSFARYSFIPEWSLSRRPYWYLMVDAVEYGTILGHLSVKYACGCPTLIILAATSIIEVVSLLFATPRVAGVVDGFACTPCAVRTSCADVISVSWPRPWVDGILEVNQLLKSWRSWEIGITLDAIFRNCACCIDNIHWCLIGVGDWYNLTRERSKRLRSLGRYDVLLYCVLYNWMCWSSSLISHCF